MILQVDGNPTKIKNKWIREFGLNRSEGLRIRLNKMCMDREPLNMAHTECVPVNILFMRVR